MSGSLVKREQPQGSRALELLSRGLGGLENRGALIKALLPNLPQLRLPFNKPPPNVIRVVLEDESRNSFNPGDDVRGITRLMVSESIAVQDITITLTGIARTKVARTMGQEPKTIYRSDVQFLSNSIEIEPESSILAPKRYEWPFEISLPRTCTIEKLQFNEMTRRFNDNLTQALPPVFADRGKETIEAVRAKCSIEYHVSAKLVSKRESQKDIHHKVPISVFLNDALAIAASDADNTLTKRCTFKFRSATLNTPPSSPPATTNEKLISGQETPKKPSTPSLGTKFKTSFMPFTLPSYSFDLDADLPKSGRLSEPLPISLRFSWHAATPSTRKPQPSMPPVSLTAATINLISRTLLRALPEEENLSAGYVIATGSIHQLWRSKPVVVAELKNPLPSLPATLDLSKHLFVRPHHFQPAFKTYNIAREYILQIVCKMECMDERFEARYEVEKFTIIAEGGVDDDFEERRRQDREDEEVFHELDSDADDEELAGPVSETGMEMEAAEGAAGTFSSESLRTSNASPRA